MKKLYLVLVIVVMLVFIFNYLNSSFYRNGNDEESIIKTIKSLDLFENSSIEIIDIKDVGDERLVAFLSNNNPAYSHFEKDKSGNYGWKSAEKRGGALSHFLIPLSKDMDDGYTNLIFLTITTKDNKISKMELGANEHIFVKEFKLNKNSAIWTELPKEKEITFKYKYYNMDGKLIKDN
ncbi:hypothetical protein BN1058_02581 [Paraliobacillus sp. PM-2]|uniref:hypothetical protein n=1 Tax=Paraliobacillus sp. PM-2 TaxID=1462524 RepID=UPI00061C595E|nr:hypothetical protein [Paraliobacillus sp. PM-2]CQR48228.1 hypothetical protein BN1058_02581 [Paraliobacillus sp. PM-2]